MVKSTEHRAQQLLLFVPQPFWHKPSACLTAQPLIHCSAQLMLRSNSYKSLSYSEGPQRLELWDFATRCPCCGFHSLGFAKWTKKNESVAPDVKIFYYHESPPGNCESVVDPGLPFWQNYVKPHALSLTYTRTASSSDASSCPVTLQ